MYPGYRRGMLERPRVRSRIRPLVCALVAVTTVLLLLNLLVKAVYRYVVGAPTLLKVFDVNGEVNVPTLWNAALLLAVSGACLLVGVLTPRRARPGRASWLVIAVVSGLMGVDELAQWHEQLRGAGSRLSVLTGVQLPTYSWVVPGAAVGLVMLVVTVRWARRLPASVGKGLVLGSLLYGAGAVVVEAFSGWVDLRYGVSLLYGVVTAVEEGLEMLGCIVVLATVLRMLRQTTVDGAPAVSLVADAPTPTALHAPTVREPSQQGR